MIRSFPQARSVEIRLDDGRRRRFRGGVVRVAVEDPTARAASNTLDLQLYCSSNKKKINAITSCTVFFHLCSLPGGQQDSRQHNQHDTAPALPLIPLVQVWRVHVL
mmetsp:Transcript_21224/g.45827  ORF Transcript_21224/g.45827 Transcript_21224/m.45827 type:complete len:106 (-) Transcript_21224:61-378(-)